MRGGGRPGALLPRAAGAGGDGAARAGRQLNRGPPPGPRARLNLRAPRLLPGLPRRRPPRPPNTGETWNLFYVKNSWGTGWGESGYFGLRASCGSPGALRMFAIPSVVPIRG